MTRDGKFLSFILGHESYCLPVAEVNEIVRLGDITEVPMMPDYVKGVTNLRGKIVPIFDLKMRFGLSGDQENERKCVIVTRIVSNNQRDTHLCGFLVDRVDEVIQLTSEDIVESEEFGTSEMTRFLAGIARVNGDVMMVIKAKEVIDERTLAKEESCGS